MVQRVFARRWKITKKTLTLTAQDLLTGGVNRMARWYLLASAVYNADGDPIMSDGTYDKLCHAILERYDELNEDIDPGIKQWVVKEALVAGSGLGTEDKPMSLREQSCFDKAMAGWFKIKD